MRAKRRDSCDQICTTKKQEHGKCSESNSSPIDKESDLREPSLLNTGPLGLGYDAD